jgi:hypothetical protein
VKFNVSEFDCILKTVLIKCIHIQIDSRIERAKLIQIFIYGGDNCQLMQINTNADGNDSKQLEKACLEMREELNTQSLIVFESMLPLARVNGF